MVASEETVIATGTVAVAAVAAKVVVDAVDRSGAACAAKEDGVAAAMETIGGVNTGKTGKLTKAKSAKRSS